MPITDIPGPGPLRNPPVPSDRPSPPAPVGSISRRSAERPASGGFSVGQLLGVTAVALLVGLVSGVLLGKAGSSAPQATAPVAPAGPVQTVYVPAPRSDTPSEQDRVNFERTCEDFLRVWVVPAPVEQRRAALAPFMTPEALAGQLAKDQGNLPAGDVAGPPLQARVVGSGGIYLTKLSSGERVEVMATRDAGGRWLVYDVQG
jgi:hypothetical protein